MTPDELLGILTALDKEGKLDPSIDERLGILPKFDKGGKEIPIILVLKHLIRSIKVQGVQDVTKLKGLYAKGTKQEKKEEKEDNTNKNIPIIVVKIYNDVFLNIEDKVSIFTFSDKPFLVKDMKYLELRKKIEQMFDNF